MEKGKKLLIGLLACMFVFSACSKGNNVKDANSSNDKTNTEQSTATPSNAATQTDLYKMTEPVDASFI
ncbi:hypothetical protein AB4Z22_45625, partial [Paenibacillus sp. TAF58]